MTTKEKIQKSVQTATYEQKDPLLVYKFESFNLFKQMIARVNKKIISFLFKANLPSQAAGSKSNSRTDNPAKQQQTITQEPLRTNE